jgi:cytochrome c oxidase subunit 2
MDFLTKLMQLPVLASEHGADVDYFIILVHALMGVLFLGWILYFFYAIFRFSKKRNPKADHLGIRNHASNYMEVAIAAVEFALLLVFAIPLWAKAAGEFPKESEALNIQVIGEQFRWNSRYPGADGILGKQNVALLSPTNAFAIDSSDPSGKDDVIPLPNEIVVPTGKPVIMRISSLDVIHSLSCHPLRICQDAIPGLSIPIHFVATKPGKYMITCAQLCGNSHYSMKGNLTVVTPEEFQRWHGALKPAGAAPTSYE